MIGYDVVEKKQMGHIEIRAQNASGLQSYLLPHAQSFQVCKQFSKSWKSKTMHEKYVCLAGIHVETKIQNGQKETDWIYEKFKTRKGCIAGGGYCRLKDISDQKCLLPADGSLRKYDYLR